MTGTRLRLYSVQNVDAYNRHEKLFVVARDVLSVATKYPGSKNINELENSDVIDDVGGVKIGRIISATVEKTGDGHWMTKLYILNQDGKFDLNTLELTKNQIVYVRAE